MEPWQEPVRGAPLPPIAYSLPGIERHRGYGARLWHNPAVSHLVGLRSTQVGTGSIVAYMPVTPWVAHPDGVLDVGLIAVYATLGASITVLEPRQTLAPINVAYYPVRRVTRDISALVGRAAVVRSSRFWVFASGTVEDDKGRVVAHTSGHYRVLDVTFPVPEGFPSVEPVEPPAYPTPDPYERPLPPDRYAALDDFRNLGCREAMGRMIKGELPRAPLYELLGIVPVEVTSRSYASELRTSAWLADLDGTLSTGVLTVVGADACGAASWAVAGPTWQLGALSVSAAFGELPPPDGRTLRVEATADPLADETVVAHYRILDGERVVVEGSMTTLLRPTSDSQEDPPVRVLVTVLLTDIVDSTRRAERAGDGAWTRILAEHHELVRREVDRARGRLVKSTGDGVLATFDSPTAAVECARAIRDGVKALGLDIRAGLHTGDIEVSAGDVAGIAVHTSARVESAAGPGEVWVSETTKALTTGSGLSFADMGEHELKGLDQPLRLWRVD